MELGEPREGLRAHTTMQHPKLPGGTQAQFHGQRGPLQASEPRSDKVEPVLPHCSGKASLVSGVKEEAGSRQIRECSGKTAGTGAGTGPRGV